jgi:hypothetical protein
VTADLALLAGAGGGRRRPDQTHWRGRVIRVSGGKPYIEVPRRSRGYEYGPCDILQGPWTGGLATGPGPDGHTHTPATPLAKNDRVLVVFLTPDDPVVVGRLV